MKGRSLEYLAGIVDGEGCISIHCQKQHRSNRNGRCYPHYALGISVFQQDVRLMKWLVAHFGGQYYKHSHVGEHSQGYSWHAPTGKDREQFILSLIPYLLLKQEQAKLALEYTRLNGEKSPEKRRLLAEKCSALNQNAPTTNTPDTSNEVKIESELHGDMQSELLVTATS